jgi:uncharacterized protein
MLTLEEIKNKGWLLFEAVSGSKAYGLDTAGSDTDIRGVFVLPKQLYYSLDYTPQVSNESNDIVYYELKRFMELLSKNNPNILEILATPENAVLYCHPLFREIEPAMFLSKQCEKSFADYAFTQVKKAYGLEKKILNPVDKERKSVLDFCFVYSEKESMPLRRFMSANNWDQHLAGLTAIPHLRDCYNLYYNEGAGYSGIARKDNSNDVSLSVVEKGEKPVALLYFNKDGYSVYCKKYKEYWDWVGKRNESRYASTMQHGKNYDAKNMMHVFRLLHMAKEIATERKINVSRPDREFLLDIKNGKFEYTELLERAERLRNELPGLFEASKLPGSPDLEGINDLLFTIRDRFYNDERK